MISGPNPPDALTRASVTVAWVIILNKPFYPLYVWWLVGRGAQASLGTLIAVPFFLLIPLIAGRMPLAARAALPAIGTVDTLLATKIFGNDAGTALFLAPCIMLVALSFRPRQAWWQRIAGLLVFLVFIITHWGLGDALFVFSAAELATLRSINIVSVASLMTFIALRYAGIARADD